MKKYKLLIEGVAMKAVVCTKYGPPEVLEFREVVKPTPKDHEVLIKIHSTTCHIGDVRVRSFNVPFWQKIPFRIFLGIFKPRQPILGMEVSGDVEAVGKNVKRFKKGDAVLAMTGFCFGGHAEYVCIHENAPANKGLIVKKPKNMSYDEAAAGTGTGGLTALELLKKADVKKEQKILIYGASGSVGVFAVQIAKHFGAEVTAVCSSTNHEMVKSLGADHVLDYTKEEFEIHSETYDIVIDAVGKLPKFGKKFMKKSGILLDVIKDTGSNTLIDTKDLEFLKELVEKGKIKTVIDRTYTLEQMVEAHRYVEKGHKKGHVVVKVIN